VREFAAYQRIVSLVVGRRNKRLIGGQIEIVLRRLVEDLSVIIGQVPSPGWLQALPAGIDHHDGGLQLLHEFGKGDGPRCAAD